MNQSYYAVIPAPILLSKTLKANSKLLYGIISSLANQKGYCYASNAYLAELLSLTRQAISKLAQDLESHNFIKIELVRQGNEVKERRIYLSGVSTNELQGVNKCTTGVSTNVLGNIYSINTIKIPYGEILEIFNNTLTELPAAITLNDTRKRNIKKLWDFDEKHQSLAWWQSYFEHVNTIDFLMGRTQKSADHRNWKCDFDFLINLNKFTKIVEGAYQ